MLALGGARASAHAAQEVRIAAGREAVRLEADQQRKEGELFIAEGHAEIQYGGAVLHADQIEYNSTTSIATARGHVVFDHETQHLEADQADYNVQSGVGTFQHVRGVVHATRRPNPTVLVSTNPLVFVADRVERSGNNTYTLYHVWMTVCDPAHPKWKFYSVRATLKVNRSAALVNANFRLFRVPLLYLPYASMPAGERLRQSGFLIPNVGESSIKGFVLGDSYYWAPNTWSDLTLGAAYLSKRGWQENGEFRMRPTDNITMSGTYFGVEDRGLPGPDGTRIPEGGTSTSFELDAQLAEGWHAVADINTLTFVHIPAGVCADVRRSGEFGGAKHGVSLKQFRRAEREFRCQRIQRFLDRTAGDLHRIAQRAGGANRSAGSRALAELARVFRIRYLWRRREPERSEFPDAGDGAAGRSSRRA